MAIRPPSSFSVAPGVDGFRSVIVNYFFVRVGRGDWVLIDAGLRFSGTRLIREAAVRFGSDRPPLAIILTHGHFDHVGALRRLLLRWPEVPVYAHPAELPFLRAGRAYAPADPLVGGGIMPLTALMYPRRVGPFPAVRALPLDGSLPELNEWHWFATPGHTPGHISLLRPKDRVLLAGDAVITTRQESAWRVVTQRREVRPPPAYFTPDWQGAYDSLMHIRALSPRVLAGGHGMPVGGRFLQEGLEQLVRAFPTFGLPQRGRYRPLAMHTV